MRAWFLVLLAATLLQITLATIYFWPQPKLPTGDEVFYLDSAEALAEGHADPEPMRAPLYAHLLWWLGVSHSHRLPIQVLQLAVYLVTAWLMRGLTRRLTSSALAADLAAALTLLYPTLAAFPLYLWPEILHLGLWVGALAILSLPQRRATWLAAAGLLLGLATLTRHLLLGFLPLILLAVWIDEARAQAGGRRSAWRALAWFGAPLAAILVPALAADHAADGHLRSASSVRFNLLVGLNDPSPWRSDRSVVFPAYLRYLASAETAAERDHRVEEKIAQHLSEAGWLQVFWGQIGKQYFRLFDRDSLFTAQLPGGRMHDDRRGYREVPPLFTRGLRWLDASIYLLILIGAAWGLCRLRPNRSVWLSLAVAFLLYNLLIFLFLHAKPRYLLQMMPFLILFAASGVAGWMEGPALATRRRLAAAGLATVLSLLAFGPTWFG